MEVSSTYKSARISTLKARDVAREIQGLPASQAIDILTYTPRKAARLINKTLKAAVANAENNFELDVMSLVVKEATVGKGPSFRRFKARARGSADSIRKPTSHIFITLTDEVELPEPKQKSSGKKKPAAKAKPVAAAAPAPKAEVKDESSTENDASSEARVDEVLGTVYDSAPAEVDDLKVISGVGPVLETKLNEQGIYFYKQIASWDEGNIAAFDDRLSFKGRIERDEWVAKAKELHQEKYGETL